MTKSAAKKRPGARSMVGPRRAPARSTADTSKPVLVNPPPSPKLALLGVNLDHIATLRRLRGTPYPDVLEAAFLVEKAGAHQITVHLREDRRHIQEDDVKRLRASLHLPLNLEMAATEEMSRFARKIRPEWVCIVPEKRQEVTTEGGLDLKKGARRLASVIGPLKKAGVWVSLFVEPSLPAMRQSAELGADAVELHTGRYCLNTQAGPNAVKKADAELQRIRAAAELARKLGLRAHAGHGLDAENVRPLAAWEMAEGAGPLIQEYNIGHYLICRAALVGMERAVREMLSAIHAP